MRAKTLPDATFPLPKFANEEEEARYFETHSVAAIWDKLSPARPVKLSPELSQAIRERHAKRKAAISLHLEPQQIAQAKRIARRKSIGHQTQLRRWIAEGIRREQKQRPAS